MRRGYGYIVGEIYEDSRGSWCAKGHRGHRAGPWCSGSCFSPRATSSLGPNGGSLSSPAANGFWSEETQNEALLKAMRLAGLDGDGVPNLHEFLAGDGSLGNRPASDPGVSLGNYMYTRIMADENVKLKQGLQAMREPGSWSAWRLVTTSAWWIHFPAEFKEPMGAFCEQGAQTFFAQSISRSRSGGKISSRLT